MSILRNLARKEIRMKNYSVRFIVYILVVISLIAMCACANGSEFVGIWFNIDNPGQCLRISQDGNQFTIIGTNGKKIAATYKDGTLDAGYFKLTYAKSSDTLLGNSGVTGSFEFTRAQAK
jgi:hypothetical protein